MNFAIAITLVQGVIFAVLGIVLIYLIIRRLRIKKTENLGDRDN
jgi:membrane protein implicated in regulation of membrane protease activity